MAIFKGDTFLNNIYLGAPTTFAYDYDNAYLTFRYSSGSPLIYWQKSGTIIDDYNTDNYNNPHWEFSYNGISLYDLSNHLDYSGSTYEATGDNIPSIVGSVRLSPSYPEMKIRRKSGYDSYCLSRSTGKYYGIHTDNGTVNLLGNIDSLRFHSPGNPDSTTDPGYSYDYYLKYVYHKLFHDNEGIVDCSQACLPSIRMGQGGYSYMFLNCTSMTKAPIIGYPNGTSNVLMYAKTSDDYGSLECMFYGCTNLRQVTLWRSSTIEWNTNWAYNWLYNVYSPGIVIIPSTCPITEYSTSGVPTGWNTETTYPSSQGIKRVYLGENQVWPAISEYISLSVVFNSTSDQTTTWTSKSNEVTITVNCKPDFVWHFDNGTIGDSILDTSSESYTGPRTLNVNVKEYLNGLDRNGKICVRGVNNTYIYDNVYITQTGCPYLTIIPDTIQTSATCTISYYVNGTGQTGSSYTNFTIATDDEEDNYGYDLEGNALSKTGSMWYRQKTEEGIWDSWQEWYQNGGTKNPVIGNGLQFFVDGVRYTQRKSGNSDLYTGLQFTGSGSLTYSLKGNLGSIVSRDLTTPTQTGSATNSAPLLRMFNSNTRISDASGLVIPGINYSIDAWGGYMFQNCTSMVYGPTLKEIYNSKGNNNYMLSYFFSGCTSLVSYGLEWTTNNTVITRSNFCSGINSTGTVYCPSGFTPLSGTYIPSSGWTTSNVWPGTQD